jgi:small-conductance mechanosensitive channel
MQHLLYGVDINNTIVHADKVFYTKLEKHLDKNQTKDSFNLQQTLLLKLKELSGDYQEKNITVSPPTSQKEYEQMFKHYLDESIKKSNYYTQLLENQQNLRLMKHQIYHDSKVDLTKQLFYAYYNKRINLLKQQIRDINKHLLFYQKNFISSLAKIVFNTKKNKSLFERYNTSLTKLNEQENLIRLKVKQSQLMNNEKNLEAFKAKIEQIKKEKYKYFRQKLFVSFLLFSKSLQDKDTKTFNYKKSMVRFIEEHNEAQYRFVKDDLKALFRAMEKGILGRIKTFEGESFEEIRIQLYNIWDIANKPLFFINKTPLSIFKLLIALLIFIIGFFIAKFYKHYIHNLASRSRSVTESTQTLLANLGHYFIFLITLFVVLNVLGIDLSSIALVAGALSVGIGFGLQNIISNFVSGIILMLERSVKIGDYIEIDENTRGRVTDIKMRSITVNTNSNIDITIPNQSLIENQVINWSMNDRIKRFEIPFGVAYGTSPQKVIEVILKAVENENCKNIFNSKERHTRVVMIGMGDSSVNFELFVWIAGKEIFYPKRTTSKFLIIIYDALYANGIEIPFPQQDIHIRSLDPSITFS